MQLSTLIGPDLPTLPKGDATEIVGLTADSREVRPGFLFAALPGTKLDGTAFIPQALKQGAAAILVETGRDVSVNVPVIADRNPRRRLALMAARFYDTQPDTIAAVTGTNGKTSVVTFLRQIWTSLNFDAASLGTVGVVTARGEHELGGSTTPDPVTLQSALAELAGEGVTHLAMEASSHGLAQFRLDGVHVTASAFTNITRDHLDYHHNFEDYAYAKLRLFGEVMAPGGVAVLNADAEYFSEFEAVCWARGHRIITVGRRGRDICLVAARPTLRGQTLELVHEGRNHRIELPLIGGFQASNALVAAGLAIGCGAPADKVFAALEKLKGAKGRLEEVAHLANGASIYIDYAHTPDALANLLEAIRPHTMRQLVVVFGCGGDRDPGKRPQMGDVAAKLADIVYVTDDNPRGEDPRLIRAEILAAVPDAIEIGDRGHAIDLAMRSLNAGDVLVVAGKGHETGQIVGSRVIPFSDHQAVSDAEARIAAEAGGGA
jgi:UDP-N-acetylmuramoyl-L-alanyl-D-glutamate--2,6-diaminopimelate ligase